MRKEDWKASGGITLEITAMEAVRCEENALVIAGPGAGKTELLTQKAGYLFETCGCRSPRKILAISFKKDSADNLKERIVTRYGIQYKDRFISMTYDAFFKSILDRFYRALPTEYAIDINYEIADTKQIVEAFINSGYTDLRGMEEYIAGKRASDMLDKGILPLADTKLKLVWDMMLRGTPSYKPAISFQMIAKLTLLILKTNPYIKTVIRATFSHVFLDEFQDTTSLQYEIVKEMFQNTGARLTAVGDNKQRIMLWAGARRTIFDDFQKDFYAKSFKLLMNHRSAPRLVDLQKKMYASLNDNPDNITASSKWNADDGIINLIIANNNDAEANTVAEEIELDIKGGVKQNDIVILCKQKVKDYTQAIIDKLDQVGIRARIESDYQDLLKDDVIKLILAIMELSLERKKPEKWDYIQSISERIFELDYVSAEKYSGEIKELEELLINVHSKLLKVNSQNDLCTLIDMIIDFFGEDKIKSIFPENRQGTYFGDKINRFFELLWEEYITAKKDWKKAISGFRGENSIPIMTIHKSKGLEYDSVYFVGLEDSAFWNFRNQPEEERCAFFVAISRAKSKITFTYCDYRINLKYKKQSRTKINEFYRLLKSPGIANIIQVQ